MSFDPKQLREMQERCHSVPILAHGHGFVLIVSGGNIDTLKEALAVLKERSGG